MPTPGLGPHEYFDEYTDFASFVLADGPTEAIATALGRPHCRVLGGRIVASHDPQAYLGWVLEFPGQPWRVLEIEEDHEGIPIAFEIDDDKFHVPFEAWFTKQFDAAREFREPVAPLRRSTPLTTAIKVSREVGCRAIAFWTFEQNDGAMAILDRGNYERVFLSIQHAVVEHRPGSPPTPVEGHFAKVVDRLLIEEGVVLPEVAYVNPGDDQTLSAYHEVWNVHLTQDDLDLSRWADVADEFG